MPWPIKNPAHNAIILEIGEQSDRAAAILAVSFLEDQYTELLKLWFADEPVIVRNILGSRGALGTFAAKIDIGLLLGVIEKKRYDELHLLRKIRNEFAHGIENLTFDTDRMKRKCDMLSAPHQDEILDSCAINDLAKTDVDKWMTEMVWAILHGPDTLRERFLCSVRMNHFNFALLSQIKKRRKFSE